MSSSAALSDSIIISVSRLVDDAQTETRQPSHSEIEFQVRRVGLETADPKFHGQLVGKAKRVRALLSWALENDIEAGQKLVANLISHLRGCGGFRSTSPNFVGEDAIQDAVGAFREEGYELSLDGELRPLLLDTLSGAEVTSALKAYVRRANRGVMDAALVIGTGKDLLEATAAHILVERTGGYPTTSNFPTLLGQAFVNLGLATPEQPRAQGEPPQARLQRSIYDVACAVNNLRNKEGTGHGRPWLPSVTDEQARVAVELMGAIAGYLLTVHTERP